ncbi:hypothetical protein PAMP_016639 [Pampus punctatissimus]
MAEKSSNFIPSDKLLRRSLLPSTSSDCILQDISGSGAFATAGRCVKASTSDSVQGQLISHSSAVVATRNQEKPHSLSEEVRSSIKPVERRKRGYTQILQGRNKSPDSSSPERKRMKICEGRSLLKRAFSQISQGINRDPNLSSPERKRPRMTVGTDERDTELPSTSRQAPFTVAQVISLKRKKSETCNKDFMSTKKKCHQSELMQLHAEFPSMKIAFSCINERQMWRSRCPMKVNNNRKIINKIIKKNIGNLGGQVDTYGCQSSIDRPFSKFALATHMVFLALIADINPSVESADVARLFY